MLANILEQKKINKNNRSCASKVNDAVKRFFEAGLYAKKMGGDVD